MKGGREGGSGSSSGGGRLYVNFRAFPRSLCPLGDYPPPGLSIGSETVPDSLQLTMNASHRSPRWMP